MEIYLHSFSQNYTKSEKEINYCKVMFKFTCINTIKMHKFFHKDTIKFQIEDERTERRDEKQGKMNIYPLKAFSHSFS